MLDGVFIKPIQCGHFKRASNGPPQTIPFTVKLKGGLNLIFTQSLRI